MSDPGVLSVILRPIGCIVGLLLILTVIVGVLIGMAWRSPASTPAQEYDRWFSEHVKTCKVCAGDPGKVEPICEESFKRMQEVMRQSRKKQ